MADINTQTIAHAGTDVTFAAATGGGDHIGTGPGVLFLVKNGGGSAITVTLATPNNIDGLAIADRTVSVGAGVTTAIPIATDLYSDPADAQCHVTYSGVTSVTIAVVKVV
jgi:hypothetical protein